MPPPAADAKNKSLFKRIGDWFDEASDWIQENMAPPELAAAIRADLGLNPDSDANAPAFAKIKQQDPDKESFAEFVEAVKPVVAEFSAFGETLKQGDMNGWDAVYLLSRVAASDTFRLSSPAVYALAKLALFVSDDPEAVEAFTPEVFVNLLSGKGFAPDASERSLRMLMESSWALVAVLEAIFEKANAPVLIDSHQGWDVPPDTATPEADRLSQGAISLLVRREDPTNAQTLGIGLVPVASEHQGPGLMLALGGELDVNATIGERTVSFSGQGTSGSAAFIPFRGGDPGFQLIGSDPGFGLKAGIAQKAAAGPVFRIGGATGTRIEIGAFGLHLSIDSQGAGVRLRLEEAALFLALGSDGFLKNMQSGELKLDFSLGLRVSTQGGFALDGGSAARVSLPVGRSIAGVFTVHSLDLEVGPGGSGRDIGLTFAGAFGVKLGPFKATVDQMGLRTDLAFRKGNLGFVDMDLAFRPPKGMGLALVSGPIRGGGYLFMDPERGRYAGALDLKMGPVGIKAIGVLSTRWPDGSDGWSLLLLIYGDFPPIQLSFGFVLSGLGGLIGLQHGIDVEALRRGLSKGVLSDVLFPRDPVGDAPRIISSLVTVFPPTRHALSIGPMVELGWGTPLIVAVQLGVLIHMDNVLGGDRPVSMSKMLLIGVVTADLPFRNDIGVSVVHLECDILGWVDFDNDRLGFEAALRNSRIIGVLELFGGLSVLLDYGEDPLFIFSAGGVFPGYPLPAGFTAPSRLGMGYTVGALKIRVESYFALTPATVQFGAKGEIWFSAGKVAAVHGWLGFDALCEFEPFHFRAEIHAGLEAKLFGKTFAGIYLDGYVTGPGHWVIDGKAKIDLWFTDIPIPLHEEWGNPPPEIPAATNVARLVGDASRDLANWSAQAPAGLDAMVGVVPPETTTALLAHPLGTVRFVQRVVPLGLKLQKFGNSPLSAGSADQFDLQEIRLNGVASNAASIHSESFSRSQFLRLSPEDRLRLPEFESMPCGIEVGTAAFTVPAAGEVQRAPIDFDTVDYDEETGGRSRFELRADQLSWQSLFGAAGVSALRGRDALRASPARVARTNIEPPEPRFTTVDAQRLKAISGATADPVLARSPTLLAQRARAQGRGALVLETFETLVAGD